MANKNAKTTKNVAGKYYVDTNCVGCGQCCDMAPEYFAEDTTGGGMYVSKQPTTPEAIEACEEALKNCPVEAIGNDGEEE
jgi:ferredoxin